MTFICDVGKFPFFSVFLPPPSGQTSWNGQEFQEVSPVGEEEKNTTMSKNVYSPFKLTALYTSLIKTFVGFD